MIDRDVVVRCDDATVRAHRRRRFRTETKAEDIFDPALLPRTGERRV
jgi:hypothetical protein